MLGEILFIAIGIIGLWGGADLAIELAGKLARMLKIHPMIVGLTIIAVGTTIPEIVTNMMAGWRRLAGLETSGIAVGNIIGSNIANITIILGLIGLFAIIYAEKKLRVRYQEYWLGIAIAAMFLACVDLNISRWEAIVLIGLYCFYLFMLAREAKLQQKLVDDREKYSPLLALVYIVFILVSLFLVVISADLIVQVGIGIGQALGMSTMIIGIFVGLGTSLPELTVSLRAALKGHKHIAVGNLIGSNIANPLLALGAGAAIAGFSVERSVLWFDFPFLIGATLLSLYLLRKYKLNRKQSMLLIAFYIAYIALRIFIL